MEALTYILVISKKACHGQNKKQTKEGVGGCRESWSFSHLLPVTMKQTTEIFSPIQLDDWAVFLVRAPQVPLFSWHHS
jgi:hypothetical protein